MPEQDDFMLLAEYCGRGAEAAFSALTKRYVNLVYSAAIRQLRDPHTAEEVTQAVFMILARKAHTFRQGVVLSGWLLRTTRFTANNVLKSQHRRIRREQKAISMQDTPSNDSPWEQIAPLVDGALTELGEKDRNAVALRFFEQKSLKDVGVALGVDADTARRRVSRALEKLRRIFARRGFTLSAAALMGALTSITVQAAPDGVLGSISSILKGTLAVSPSVAALTRVTLKYMAWTKCKTSIAAAVLITLAAGTVAIVNTAFARTERPIPGTRFRLPVGAGVPAVGLGAAHGIILASDGSLWSWGESTYGWSVLGLGNIRTQLCLRRIGTETNWMSIAVGDTHNLALKSDGSLWAWGEGIYGQLGDGITDDSGSGPGMQNVPVPSAPGNDWKQVAAGGSHSVALKQNGTLWAWGNNWAGQLGIGLTNAAVHHPMQVGTSTNWVKVWAGLLETVAMQSDGSLWYWGDNPDPTIPQTGPDSSNIFAPMRISPDTNWVEVGFGPWTVLAIKSDGTLWALGRLAHYYTGEDGQSRNPTFTRVGTAHDWRSLSQAAWFYATLLKKDGSLWAMEARNVTTGSPPEPLKVTQVGLGKNPVAFGAGASHQRPFGAALTADGEVWTWGKVLGQHTPAHPRLQSLATRIGWKTDLFESKPVTRDRPWRLPNVTPD